MLRLCGRGWFPDFGALGLREFLNVRTMNLSVAVWVGFLALFGIASDDGVVIATYLTQSFAARRPDTACWRYAPPLSRRA